METIQQQLNALQISVKRQRLLNIVLLGVIVAGGFIAAVRPVGDATFDIITCKGWKVIDADGKRRIMASTIDGQTGVVWFDKNEKLRIAAATRAEGKAVVVLSDRDEQLRIVAATRADGTVMLPTQDLGPPKP